MRLFRIPLMLAALLALAGCAGDKGATLACPRPDGTSCEALSEVYERTAPVPARLDIPLRAAPPAGAPPSSRLALRPARLLRVWVAPWQDAGGDLHDQQYLYLVLEPARWELGPAQVVRPPAATENEE
ncbi:MAG: TraV family lipoprotein [Betaproteobacteria bacterium AqS2]|uniref:TraV family lipoprotein n=1 Tax=Candidatus Amphirhobacter heronislandensis TaxID=1732024 RepID=A0A930UBU5_9GAMM|nr:TraV family lipoprotein [Betaproteobacteria bacterium AqS2]